MIEAREATEDHDGALTLTYLDPEDAAWLAGELVRLVREIGGARAGKLMPLASAIDPYLEDR